MGLSPPTRGNLTTARNAPSACGSIPAHAGEPEPGRPTRASPPVYPRPRGGTSVCSVHLENSQGLSPPTRGNPIQCQTIPSQPGSIPAHAGEPLSFVIFALLSGVYPRPRGGTMSSICLAARLCGLSPPTRGNRPDVRQTYRLFGSIPAHAGEPAPCLSRNRPCWVYPRPRGGTSA